MAATAIIDWQADGAPRSQQFDDIYFSSSDGLAEARAVYLEGCGLPEAWRGKSRFVVGELGFGTGLNIVALLELWRRTREPDARLHVFSLEAFPVSASDAKRALAAWPALADLSRILTADWPLSRGFHRLDVSPLNVVIDLAIMEAAEALRAWDGAADAWFLDGFAPSRNPDMWREEVLKLVAERSASDARVATFTVAGAVRRGLQAQGFEITKRTGFGGKSERLEGRLGPRPKSERRSRRRDRVAIVGQGIAGASLARAFRAEGIQPVLIDRLGQGSGASGNPAALVTPRFDAGGGSAAQLYAQAFQRAVTLYRKEAAEAVISHGAVVLEATDRDARRFDTVVQSNLFEEEALSRLSPERAGVRLGEATKAGGIWVADALVIEPLTVLSEWFKGCERRSADVRGLSRGPDGWRLMGPRGEIILEVDLVCVAAGLSLTELVKGLKLDCVRGQASFSAEVPPPPTAAWGAYLLPTRDGLLFGATHDRGQSDVAVRLEDHRRNLDLLARQRPALARSLKPEKLDGRAGLRASARDYLPVAGPVAGLSDVFMLSGLGGRGFTLAPLLAEHIVALALGAPSPLPLDLSNAVDPDRFSRRSAGR